MRMIEILTGIVLMIYGAYCVVAGVKLSGLHEAF